MADKLTVIVPTAGRSALLRRTLHSLVSCEKPSIYRETIVVENGPKGSAEEIVCEYSPSLNARYLYVEEGNKSNALNEAIARIDGGLVFFVDDDVLVDSQALMAYAEAVRSSNEGKFFGGTVEVDHERTPSPWLRRYLPPSVLGQRFDRGYRLEKVPPCFLGCNWAAFAEDIRRAGGFDPGFGPGSPTGSRGQETVMQKRLLRMGLQGIYVIDAAVRHYVPAERCSPLWAAQRGYQDGKKEGLQRNWKATSARKWRWSLRKKLRKAVRFLRTMMLLDRAAWFGACHSICFHYGFVVGLLSEHGPVPDVGESQLSAARVGHS